jgi:hypothetical protein
MGGDGQFGRDVAGTVFGECFACEPSRVCGNYPGLCGLFTLTAYRSLPKGHHPIQSTPGAPGDVGWTLT